MAATINASTSSGIVTSADNSGQLELQTANTTRLTIDLSGAVGLGTTSPAYRLDVRSSVATINIQSTTGTNYAALFIQNTGGLVLLGEESSTGGSIFPGTSAYSAVFGTTASYPVAFATNNTERMRIDSSGNVGIGTSSPSQNLVVNRNAATAWAPDTSVAAILSDNTTSGDNSTALLHFQVRNSVATTGGVKIGAVAVPSATNNYSGDFVIANRNNGTYQENMRVTYNGNVGIGVTPAGTGLLELAAGTATVAPLEFTSGTNLTTPVAGAVEYDGTIMTATSNTNFKRGTIPLTNYTSGTGITLGTNTEATLQRLLPAANDTITLSVGTYFFDTQYIVTRGASTTSATTRLNILGAGTAAGTFSAMGFSFINISGSPSGFAFNAVNINVTNVVSGASTTSGGLYYIQLRGILKITSSGTIIPQYNLSVNINGAGTVSNVWYFRLQQLDTQSAAAFGPAGTGWA